MSYPVEELQRFGYQQELRRALRFRDLLAYGLILMVPVAPMAIFGAVLSASGGMVLLYDGMRTRDLTQWLWHVLIKHENPTIAAVVQAVDAGRGDLAVTAMR
ncbi:hypothetical protein Aca07nite_87820 [Actinoplanes capillaceus]|uniref:Uncharacterized protein n=1 Tax=Actinoplanes campanulatus TaxID=113559 RepID=A0ABQ3WZ01_9ACTN|nr:hypothetical protein Aca07nite_87820 [Actinoplanes capillaceus]